MTAAATPPGHAPTIAEGIEGLRGLVGVQLGVTPPLPIEQRRVDAFADTTGDHQWIHVDVERARSGPFGAPIAHGYLTLSLCAMFSAQLLEVRGISMAVNYGLDRVRFPSPVPVGSSLTATGRLLTIEDVEGGVQAKLQLTVTAQGAPKPCCVAEVVARYYA
jgi:acyl dehydratase